MFHRSVSEILRGGGGIRPPLGCEMGQNNPALLGLKGQSPAYISDHVTVYQPQRTLRSASQYLLQESIGRPITYGRSFSRVAPMLWNRLLLALRSPQTTSRFKAQLKTHLFRIAYDSQELMQCVLIFFRLVYIFCGLYLVFLLFWYSVYYTAFCFMTLYNHVCCSF